MNNGEHVPLVPSFLKSMEEGRYTVCASYALTCSLFPKHKSLLIGSGHKIIALEQPDSPELSLAIGDELISSVANAKHLELQVDQNLSWEQHVLLITVNISKCIGMLQ